MKDVSEILAKRLKQLDDPFSRDWLTNFSSFIEFIQTNPITVKILEAIKKDKEVAHEPLIDHLKILFEDGSRCLKEIETKIGSKNEVGSQIRALSKLKVNPTHIQDPFFDLGSLYHKYCSDFASLLGSLVRDGSNAFISKYCTLNHEQRHKTARISVDLTFSPYLQKCKQDIEKLSGQRTTSIWGRWDTLLKWAEWTKNGIPPTNEPFEQNLSALSKTCKYQRQSKALGYSY
jgi:hypothetical protein